MDDLSPINVTAREEDTSEPIRVNTPFTPQLSPNVAAVRAAKATMGLGGIMGQEYGQIYNSIYNNEDNFRQEAASAVDYQKAVKRRQAVVSLASQGAGLDTLKPLLTSIPKTDPKSVVEQNYAKQFISPLTDISNQFMSQTFMKQAVREFPEDTKALTDAGADMAAKSEYMLKKQQEMEDLQKKQGWFPYLAQTGVEFVVPGIRQLALRGNVPGAQGFKEGGLLGTQLEEERKRLWRLPMDQFTQVVDSTLDKMKVNPSVARDWAHSMYGQSVSDKFLDDVFSVFDVGFGVAEAKGLMKMSRKTLQNQVQTAVKQSVQATSHVQPTEISPEEAAWENEGGAVKRTLDVAQPASTGNLGEAAIKQSSKNLVEDIKHTSSPPSRAIQALPSVYINDMDQIASNLGNFGQDIVNRLEQQYQDHLERFSGLIENNMRTNQVPELTSAEDLMRALRTKADAELPNKIEDGLINTTGPHREKETGTWHVKQIIARATGEPFGDEKEAKIWARINKLSDTTPYQMGGGWYLENKVPVNIYSDIVRDALGTTEYSKAPHSLFDNFTDAIVGWIRNPDETMPIDDRINRKLATVAPENFMQHARQSIQEIADIAPKASRLDKIKKWNDWKRLIDAGQTINDPETGKPGYWFKSPGEIEQWYDLNIGRRPEEDEIMAYFAAKRLGADDLYFRRLAKYRNAYNVGAQNYTVSFKNDAGKVIDSDAFDAVKRTVLPGSEDTMAIIGKEGKAVLTTRPGTNLRKIIMGDVKENKAVILELLYPYQQPLKGFAGITESDYPRYVISYKHTANPLDFESQVPRTGGIHFEYDYPHYLKKANVKIDPTSGRPMYLGEHTILALPNRRMGEKIAEKLNAVDKLISANKIGDARSLFESNFKTEDNVPANWDKYYANYSPSRGKNRFSTREPYLVIDRDKSIMNSEHGYNLKMRYPDTSGKKSALVDTTKRGAMAQAQVQFTGERDAYDLLEASDKGTRNNPIFTFAPAKKIDPISMLNRGYARIVHSNEMDPYKAGAIEHWLFGDADGKGNGAVKYLKNATPEEVKQHPFYFFNSPEFVDMDPILLSRLMQSRYKIRSFASIPSVVSSTLDAMSSKLADATYGALGPKGSKLAIAPSWLISHLDDAPQVMRSAVFHPKMGLFNPAQYMVHASGFVITSAIAGARPAAGSTLAAILHGFMSLNKKPSTVAYMDKLASKFSHPGSYAWKPGWFTEANKGLVNSGFMHVESSQLAALDMPTSNKIIRGGGKKFLDAGETPFRSGVKQLRAQAWYTSYLEYRYGGGGKFKWPSTTGPLNDDDWGRILERADILSHNMTRASTSIVQKGMASFGMQFAGFDLRVLELLTGKRLTFIEKARLFGTYLGLYGVRTTAGLVGLAEVASQIGDEAGYQPGQNVGSTALWEGALPTLIGVVTGGGDIRKGNVYNIGPRYGAKDLSIINNALDKDATTIKIFGGAVQSEIASIWSESTPFRHLYTSFLRGDGKYYTVTWADAFQFAKEISSINMVDRAYWQMVNHRTYSKTGRAVASDVTTMDAAFMLATGLTHQDWANVYEKTLENKGFKQRADQAKLEARQAFVLHLQALRDHDDASAVFYGKRARWLMSALPEDQWDQVVSSASKDREDLVDVINRERYDLLTNKNLPRDKDTANKYRDIYHGILQYKRERKE